MSKHQVSLAALAARDGLQADLPPAGSSLKRVLRNGLLAGASILAVAAAGYYGTQYWNVGRFQVSTDDAYVQADNAAIAPKVSGYLSEVLVNDNEPVRAGQVVARIDPRDFQVALEQARSNVASAHATIANKQAALQAQRTVIDGARATIEVDEASERFAEQDDQRYTTLAKDGWGTVQKAQEASSRISAARAAITRDAAGLANATCQIDVLSAELAQAQAALWHAKSLQDQAELNLSYTTILAPNDGVIGNRTLRVGQYVQAGTQLMSDVPAASAYIVANYKETQLTAVRTGQPVSISVDMFPGQVFHGHVDSLAPASGQEFSLLPPDNATGNFTKVVQRIPVKILLDHSSPLAVVLRPGMSVYPSIDTRTDADAVATLTRKS
jgi:membrane fusion protein, multidrug efflux system